MAYNNDLISIFGLNTEQFILFVSFQKILTEKDIEQSADKNIKKIWLKEWEEYFLNYIKLRTSKENFVLLDENGIIEAIEEYKLSGMNMTWYYSILIELINFRPYFSWNYDSEKDKLYSKLKYKDQYQTIREIVLKNNLVDEKTLNKLTITFFRKLTKLGKSSKKQMITFIVFCLTVVTYFLNIISFMDVSIVMLILLSISSYSLFTTNLLKQQSSFYYIGSDLYDETLALISGGMLLGLSKEENNDDNPFILTASNRLLSLIQSAKLYSLIKVILIELKGDNLTTNSILKQLKEQLDILKNDIQSPNYNYEKYNVIVKHLHKSYSFIESDYNELLRIVSKFEKAKYN